MSRDERHAEGSTGLKRVGNPVLIAVLLITSGLGLVALGPVGLGGHARTGGNGGITPGDRQVSPILPAAQGAAQPATTPVAFPQGLLYYAPILVTNSALLATESPFDLSVGLSCAVLATYAPADLQNIEFFDSAGNVIPSWHQSGTCSSQVGEASYWVRLPSGIAATSSETIFLGIGPSSSILLNGRTTGAAPTCYGCTPTAPYGTYDDGASVFAYYQAWGSLTALPQGWSVSATGGDALAFKFQTNQTVVSGGTSGSAALQNSTAALASVDQPFVWETYGSFDNPNSAVASGQGLLSTAWITESSGGAGNLGCALSNGFHENFGADTSSNHLYAIQVTDASTLAWSSAVYVNGSLAGCQVLAQAVSPVTVQGFTFPTYGGQSSGSVSLLWTAIQTLPPGGVMPSVSVGAVVVAPTPYDVTFTESGLATGTTWSTTFGGVTSTSVSSGITFAVGNGSFNYTVGQVAGYASSTVSGSVTVSGAGVAVPIAFAPVPPASYSVSFSETGLPSGTTWSVTLAGSISGASGPEIAFSEPNGSYAFSVAAVAGFSSRPSTGNISVQGNAVSQSIAFNATGTLRVAVTPLDAHVTVDGRTTAGSGGVYLWTLVQGSYYVNATRSGTTPYSDLVSLSAGTTVALSIVLAPVSTYGYLTGSVTPTNATVTANNVIVPLENGSFNVTLTPGTYYVSVSASGYSSLVTETNVTAGAVTRLQVGLPPASSTVTLSGQITPANASVVVDGVVAYVNATGQFHVSVLAGTYALSFSAAGWFPFSEALTLTSNVWLAVALTAEPVATSTVASGNVTATGYNVSITNVATGAGSVSVTFTSGANGTLLVTTPFADLSNLTVSEVLGSRVFVNGARISNFSITLSSTYQVTLSLSHLPADPTLFWALSPSAAPPSSSRTSLLGLPASGWYSLAAGLAVASVAVAFVAGRRSRGPRRRPESRPPSVRTSPGAGNVEATGIPPSHQGEDALHDFF